MRSEQVAAWDAADLVRRLCGVLDLARQAVERFAAKGFAAPANPAARVQPEKLIGETAILLHAASAAAAAQPQLRERIDALAHLLIPHARSERMMLGICLEPSVALDYAEAHILLSALGYRDAHFDTLLRQCVTSQAGAGRERVPHRALEQQWIAGVWRQCVPEARGRAPRRALDLVLKRPLDVLSRGLDEAYAFTHALMYVADFSRCRRRLPRARAAIAAEAEALLARCLDEENYDLGGEMLMMWPLAGAPWSAGATFGFRVLAALEDRDGMVPAPGAPPANAGKPENAANAEQRDGTAIAGTPIDDERLARGYHTAYVMGLLCAASLSSGCAPPLQFPAQPSPQAGSADAMLRLLGREGPQPFWQQEFDRLAGTQRDALAGFLLDIGLARTVRRRDFGAVHTLLKTGYAHGLATTPASSQAAEMLERLAMCKCMTGAPPAESGWGRAA
jgi:hypothetical protein